MVERGCRRAQILHMSTRDGHSTRLTGPISSRRTQTVARWHLAHTARGPERESRRATLSGARVLAAEPPLSLRILLRHQNEASCHLSGRLGAPQTRAPACAREVDFSNWKSGHHGQVLAWTFGDMLAPKPPRDLVERGGQGAFAQARLPSSSRSARPSSC